MGSQMTDRYGRVSHQLPDGKLLPVGMYPVKMVVRSATLSDYFLPFRLLFIHLYVAA